MSDAFDGMIPERPSPARKPTTYEDPQVDALLLRLRHMIASARAMPMSASSMINKEEVLSLLDELTSQLPDELRAARWLLKEREEFLGQVRAEGDDILTAARSQSEQMVQRTEVVRSAETRARQILEKADAESRQMKREAEDYCDQKLGSFEIVLEKTLGVVGAGRAKLQGNPLAGLSQEGLADAGPASALPPSAGYPHPQPPTGQHLQVGNAVEPGYPQPRSASSRTFQANPATSPPLDPMTGTQSGGAGFFDQETE